MFYMPMTNIPDTRGVTLRMSRENSQVIWGEEREGKAGRNRGVTTEGRVQYV